jgi:hypothetical protein
MFDLEISATAESQLELLEGDASQSKRCKAVKKALRLLANDPRHPGLHTHEWKSTKCPHGGKMFEAYAENNTPGAYRIFFCYPPELVTSSDGDSPLTAPPKRITIVAITAHP